MLTKTHIKNTRDSLPGNLTVEQISEHLIILNKVNKGWSDPDNGRINIVEEVKQKL